MAHRCSDNRGPTVFSILYKERQSIIHGCYAEYFAFAYTFEAHY